MRGNSTLKGLVFLIDRFVVEDGPGIRTTVFMKGCPLSCIWCHSPQSQSAAPQLAFYRNRCIGCGSCFRVCTKEAQIVSATDRRVTWENCDNCGKCAEACPSKALEMVGEWLTVAQLMNIIGRDLVYYKNSGGGVTFSGGEPTAQREFLTACLQKCRDLGIHTALDTCGFAEWPVFEQVLPYIDLLLYDIKCMDSRKHEEFTGVSNDLILENLKRSSQQGKSIWIRIPLIPGYNDSEENLSLIARFIGPLKGVKKVSFLPYNAATSVKYQLIGKNYPLEHIAPHSKKRLKAFIQIFSRLGIRTELGR